MIRTQRRFSLLLLSATAFFLLLIPPALANGAIGMGWGFMGAAPGLIIGFITSGIALAGVIVIETVVFRWIFRIGWLHALWVSFILNIISTALGLLFAVFTFTFVPYFFITGAPNPLVLLLSLLPFILITYWMIAKRDSIPSGIMFTVVASILIGFFASIRSSFEYLPDLRGISEYSGYILPLLLGFGLTLLFEGIPAPRYYKGKNLWKGILIANIISYVFLASIAAYYGPTDLTEIGYWPSNRHEWMSRAKGQLRSIGTTQLAYQQGNERGVYGSFEALQDVQNIATDHNLGNIIENYSLVWEINHVSTVPTERFPDGIITTFTVVAYPRNTMEGYMYTFAITEDQVLREYDPDVGHSPDDVHTWDPIL